MSDEKRGYRQERVKTPCLLCGDTISLMPGEAARRIREHGFMTCRFCRSIMRDARILAKKRKLDRMAKVA